MPGYNPLSDTEQTQKNGFQRDPDGSDQNGRVKKVSKKFGIIPKLKGRNVITGRCPQPKAVDYDETYGDDQKKKDCA